MTLAAGSSSEHCSHQAAQIASAQHLCKRSFQMQADWIILRLESELERENSSWFQCGAMHEMGKSLMPIIEAMTE
jgi:hypothetical protein